MQKPIYSITPFTVLDYPKKTACILWFAGCNMRCSYCYNPDIVLGKGKLSIEEAIAFLRSRRSLLQGVVFSGGECSLHPAIIPLAQAAKEMGYLIKMDSNGSRPDRIKKLIQQQCLDYVAMDFKAPGHKHAQITHSNTFAAFEKSLRILLEGKIPFEVRTTWHSELLSTEDLRQMVQYLEEQNYKGNFYIQPFLGNTETLEPLPISSKKLDTQSLSTATINVVMRS